MAFVKGREKTGGRVKGTPNKVTAEFKETVMNAINDKKYIEKLKKERPELLVALCMDFQCSARRSYFHQVEPVSTTCQFHLVFVALCIDDLHDVIHLNVRKVAKLIRASGKRRLTPCL